MTDSRNPLHSLPLQKQEVNAHCKCTANIWKGNLETKPVTRWVMASKSKLGLLPLTPFMVFISPAGGQPNGDFKPHCLGLCLSVCAHTGKPSASLIQIMWQIGLFNSL